VFGVFLIVIAMTAMVQAMLVTTHFSTAALETAVSRDRALMRMFVASNIRPTDLHADTLTEDRVAELGRILLAVVENGEIERLELRDLDGHVLASSAEHLSGAGVPESDDYRAATTGTTKVAMVDAGDASEMAGPPPAAGPLMRAYLPIMSGGEVLAVAGIWRDATPVLASMEEARRDVITVTLAASLIAAAILLLVFWGVSRRLRRRTRDLLEAERRDPLTGLLNHGSLVSVLAEAIEVVRTDGRRLTIALIDLDSFRLLNDTHGHTAGDTALLEVARLLDEVTAAEAVVGRYGPDEFLVISGPDDADQVVGWIERLRGALTAVALQFGDSERLPITVSVGIGTYPPDAAATTELLSAATTALSEAKASGGDTVRLVRQEADKPVEAGYNVLQGLVIAIDTKDHYTKRHSEDVARYAVFLARQLGFDDEACRVIRVAGLLHDVGKIGIPDALLRKPGRLTTEEYLIFRQHVALGDLIVRDLPHVEQVRAGIRHHHERWDGSGYLDNLAGDEIPLIARVLAVADAFSAMTTSRPYRKALDTQEALKRLGDAAGTQLEEGMTRSFIHAIETAPDAPQPGDDRGGAALWTPVTSPAEGPEMGPGFMDRRVHPRDGGTALVLPETHLRAAAAE
jgi:diguanylate cyclase (GGDEF)-like protein/putative nucleotidyltransferase with HDIG domain